MPNEISTRDILDHAFTSGKKVYVPRVVGPREIVMLEARSLDDVDSFETSKLIKKKIKIKF